MCSESVNGVHKELHGIQLHGIQLHGIQLHGIKIMWSVQIETTEWRIINNHKKTFKQKTFHLVSELYQFWNYVCCKYRNGLSHVKIILKREMRATKMLSRVKYVQSSTMIDTPTINWEWELFVYTLKLKLRNIQFFREKTSL